MFGAKRYIDDMIDGLRDPSYPDASIKYEGIPTNNSDSGGNCNAEEKSTKNNIQ